MIHNTTGNQRRRRKTTKMTTTTTTLRGKYCSPRKMPSSFNTCYTRDDLLEIATSQDKQNRSFSSMTTKEIWDYLDDRFHSTCSSEACWSPRHKHRFRPSMPKTWKRKPYTWLSNVDIERVMHQYEDVYPEFLFIGPVPIDFQEYFPNTNRCIGKSLCTFDLGRIHHQVGRRVSKIGIVFNLDQHHEEGSHWVAMFLNLKEKTIYYFDSTGSIPGPEINRFVEFLQKQDSHYTFQYNTIQHQYKNTECGIYCILFLANMIEETLSFNAYIHDVKHDEEVHPLRWEFFSPPC